MKKILLLAQTPPPFHGQSIMQDYLVRAEWEWCKKEFLRLDFSDTIGEVGSFKIKKIYKLFGLILKVWKNRLKGPIEVLFYPPAGPLKIPFYRDVLLLCLIRFCSRKIIYQFHAGNFDALQTKLNGFERKLAMFAYQSPDAAIVLLPTLQKEVEWINPKKVYVVPNGIGNVKGEYNIRRNDDCCRLLFVGLLSEKKGVLICLNAVKILSEKNINFKFTFVGGWASNLIREKAEKLIEIYNLSNYVEFVGVKSGSEKWKTFSNSDIFCMPTFETEAMPITILEAMMMGMPVITTNWRSNCDIVDDNITGILIPIKDPVSLADKILYLIENKDKRLQMGENGEKKYLSEYSIEKHLFKMEEVFREVYNKEL